jgi:hypothetical protein
MLAGILNIVSGVTHLCGAIIVLVFGWLGDGVFNILWYGMVGTPLELLTQPVPQEIQRIVVIPVCILSALAIAGGICAFRRKAWRLAFAGSIGGMLLTWFLGLLSLILILLSKKQYAIR